MTMAAAASHSPPYRARLTTLGFLWCLPYTLLGLVLALLSLGRPRAVGNVLVVESARGWAHLFLTRRGFGAVTFGRLIISAVPMTAALLVHEREHVRQYETWGPLFMPLYLYHHMRRGYWKNPFELAAVACASAFCTDHPDAAEARL